MSAAGFWDDQERAQKVVQRLKFVKGVCEPVQKLQQEVEDLQVLRELGEEEKDAATLQEVETRSVELERALDSLELRSMLGEQDDQRSAFLSVHAGAGGTESCDWAQMLLRMYARWAEHQGYGTELVEEQAGEQAGLKSATLHVIGPLAFGYLKSEIGVHRLVRISPFDANKRRHTTFAAVDVVPELEDDAEIELKDDEIEMEFIHASGPGGQHVNKASTAVRLRHIPTGLIVMSQSERSQRQNRNMAELMLKSKLHQLEIMKKQQEFAKLYDEKGEIAWGYQIRSYVLQPYQMVKDLRTEHKTSATDAVLDGDLTPFMEAYLRQRLAQKSNK
jgi:peptide chain release factor 2